MFTVEEGRAALLGRVIRIFAVVGLLAYIPSMVACLETGLYALAVVDSVAYLLVLVAAVLPRFAFRIKLLAMIAALFTVGVAVLIWTGPYGAGYLWIMCGVIISALFGSRRVIVMAFVLAVVALVAYGMLVATGFLEQTFPLISLVVIGTNMIAICVGVAYVIHAVQKSMEGAMEKQEILSQELHHRVKNNLQVTLSLISLEAYGADPTPHLIALERRVRILTAVNELFLAQPYSLRMDVRAIARAVASCAQQWTIVVDDGLEEKTDSGPFEMDSADAAHFAIGLGELVNLLEPNTVFIAAQPKAGSFPPRIRLSLAAEAPDGLIRRAHETLSRDATIASLLGGVGFRVLAAESGAGPGFEIDALG